MKQLLPRPWRWILALTLYPFWPVWAVEKPRAWNLKEIESAIRQQNSDILSIQTDRDMKASENEMVSARFQPSLFAKVGVVSENTEDEQRSGPVLTLEGRWNLYRGGRDELARRRLAVETSHVTYELAARTHALLFDARSLFYQVLAAQQKQRLLEQEISLTDRQAAIAHRRTRAGVATMADELEFQLRGEELTSQLRSLEAQKEKHLIALKELMNQPQAENLAIKGEWPKVIDRAEVALIDSHPTLLRLRDEVALQTLESERVRAEYRPEIEAFASLGKISPTPRAEKFESVVGLSLAFPLYDGFQQRAAQSVAELKQKKALIELGKVQRQLSTEIETIRLERSELDRLKDLNEKRLAYAEKYLQVTIEEYERGVKNSPDVLGASEHLFGSKIKKIDLALQAALLGAKVESIFQRATEESTRSEKNER